MGLGPGGHPPTDTRVMAGSESPTQTLVSASSTPSEETGGGGQQSDAVKIGLGVGIGVGVALLAAVALLTFYWVRKRARAAAAAASSATMVETNGWGSDRPELDGKPAPTELSTDRDVVEIYCERPAEIYSEVRAELSCERPVEMWAGPPSPRHSSSISDLGPEQRPASTT